MRICHHDFFDATSTILYLSGKRSIFAGLLRWYEVRTIRRQRKPLHSQQLLDDEIELDASPYARVIVPPPGEPPARIDAVQI